MADTGTTVKPSNATLISVGVVIAVLYFAREIFIPIALALLFSFLLAPLVLRLRHWGFGRLPSVLTVVALSFLIVAIMGSLVTLQLTDLAHQLPQYQQTIHKKVDSLRASSSGLINHLTQVIQKFSQDLSLSPAKGMPGEEKPVPVEIRRSPFSPLQAVQTVLGSLINLLLTAVIVVVFVIFMLIQQEDLRDRLIRLAGSGQLHITTRALDEAGVRVSRYLLAQLAVNSAYGVVAGVGLYFLGVPNPVLWAVLAALFRYVPYLGIWIAAIMPAAVAMAVSPGWIKPVGIVGLYFGIDLLMYNLVEPVLYGNTTGISPMAILVAAVFWTWLWGPVGLLLSTPLTVCVVVMGRYMPSLEFLGVLLSDEPVLGPEQRFYQRLLAMDVEEAAGIAEEYLKGESLEALYDRVILPAMGLAEEDRHRGRLDPAHQQYIYENARFLVEQIGEHAGSRDGSSGAELKMNSNKKTSPTFEEKLPNEISVLSMPARDEADEIGALMLAQLLGLRGVAAKPVSVSTLASEKLEEAALEKIKVACVSAVPPSGYTHARYLCKRLRDRFPNLKIVAAILNQGDTQEVKRREPKILADEIATTLGQAVAEILSMIPVPAAAEVVRPAIHSHAAEG